MKNRMYAAGFRRIAIVGSIASVGMLTFSCSSEPGSTIGGASGAGTTPGSGGATATGGKGAGQGGIKLGEGIPQDSPKGPCMGLECAVPACAGAPKTTISGRVYAPNGTLPLYNVLVYVPNAPVMPFTDGATCDRCDASVLNPVTSAVTDEQGNFVLQDAPAGQNVPLVIQVGKWRRQITVPSVAPCADTPLTDPNVTRLPKNKAEGDLPRIAISAGGADQMECLPLRLGIDPAEFTPVTGDGRIHLFVGDYNQSSGGGPGGGGGGGQARIPVRTLDAARGSTPLTPAADLWSTVESLKKYDLVILSCEGDDFPTRKPMQSRQALYDYASQGGRVFASHWHNIWFAQGPDPVPSTGTWSDRRDPLMNMGLVATVNTTFPKGAALAKWLVNVNASTTEGQMVVNYPRDNIQAVNAAVAREWITIQNDQYETNPKAVQYMSFNTPIGATEDKICGRAVYTDLHVASVDNPTADNANGFPTSCGQKELTAQEKAVAFMLFDLSSCVQNEDKPPRPPK
jgi:hypothetical protein